jgi:histidinol-phosphatase (PHP family)
MKRRDIDNYIADVKLLKRGYSSVIDIYLGLEADYIPGKSNPKKIKEEFGLDYVIGSVHYVKQFNSGVPFQIDGSPEDFERGFNEIFHRDSRKLISEYYRLVREMVQDSTPDILGHLDKIVMHCTSHQVFKPSDYWYSREIMDTLEVVRDAGTMIEVNTRSMYKRKMAEPYPALWILEKIREMEIPVVLNSDAHRPNEIIGSYNRALTMLHDVGITSTRILKEGDWIDQPLEINAVR